MGNLIADLKLFASNGGNHLILKHDFHKGDDFLEGYRIVSREEIGAIIEFFASTEEDRIDSDVFEYNYDPVDLDEIRSSLSIHSSSDKDVNDMARIFGAQIGDCHWLDTIATCQMNDQLTITEYTYATILTPELLEKYNADCFPFASTEALKRVCAEPCIFGINLSGLTELPEEGAKLFTGEHDLDLSGLATISDEAAEGLLHHTGSLNLSGLESLSPHAAELLAQHKGSLYLGGLTEISDEVAQALSKHHGTLTLTGLTSLSDTAAEALSKHDGEVELPNFDGEEDDGDAEEDEEDEE
jgi:hypothetical protein